MKSVKRYQEYEAPSPLSSDPDGNAVNVALYYAWGDTVVATTAATRNGAGDYSYTFTADNLKSGGIHKITWSWTESSVAKTQDDYINVYTEYVNSLDFFEAYSGFETEFDDHFSRFQQQASDIINTYCGQNFEPVFNKTLTIDGNGKRSIQLPIRIESWTDADLLEVEYSGTTTSDVTDYIEKDPDSDGYFLRYKSATGSFPEASQLQVVGDWGWGYVPRNVKEAAMLLIADLMSPDSAYIKHGVEEIYLDTHRMRFTKGIFGTTGNLDADTLLMDYTLFFLTII